jgi:hypothetical protein
MRTAIILVMAMSCWALPACSGGTKGPGASAPPDGSTAEPVGDKALAEGESEVVDPGKTPPPELVMEVVGTVLR